MPIKKKHLDLKMINFITLFLIMLIRAASAILNEMLLEQRHKTAMADVEHEMKIELDRSKNELYTQLQHDLEQELQVMVKL